MIDITAALTISYAFASAGSRGVISVIDRHQFGIRKKSIIYTNIFNNIAASFLSLVLVLVFAQEQVFFSFISNMKVIVFALLLQLSANAFSYAFKHMKVASMTVAAKMSDIFIGPLIYVLFSIWSTGDFLFAVLTSAICLSLIFSKKHHGFRDFHMVSALTVCVTLILQGVLSPWYVENVSQNQLSWMPFTAALVCWRLIFSWLFSLDFSTKVFKGLWAEVTHAEFLFLLLSRAVLTLAAQGFLVLSLSLGRPVLAWPILNATGLVAALLSAWLLKEKATKTEVVVICLIALLGLVKVLL